MGNSSSPGEECLEDLRKEDKEADGGSGDGAEENAGGAEVLDVADALVLLRLDDVAEALQGGVEDLRREHEADGECHQGPFNPGNLEDETGRDDQDRRKEVHPGVVLLAEQDAHAAEREAETSQHLFNRESLVIHVQNGAVLNKDNHFSLQTDRK